MTYYLSLSTGELPTLFQEISIAPPLCCDDMCGVDSPVLISERQKNLLHHAYKELDSARLAYVSAFSHYQCLTQEITETTHD